MNDLIRTFSPLDEIEVAKELDRLFALQDRPLSNDKKSILVTELSVSGMPKSAVVAGIRDLVSEDLKQIKLCTLIQATKKHFRFVDTKQGCDRCSYTGNVSVATDDGYIYSIPCVCDRGTSISKAQNLGQWSGTTIHYLSDGRKAVLIGGSKPTTDQRNGTERGFPREHSQESDLREANVQHSKGSGLGFDSPVLVTDIDWRE